MNEILVVIEVYVELLATANPNAVLTSVLSNRQNAFNSIESSPYPLCQASLILRNLHHLAEQCRCSEILICQINDFRINRLHFFFSFVEFNELIKVNFSCFANCLVVSLFCTCCEIFWCMKSSGFWGTSFK